MSGWQRIGVVISVLWLLAVPSYVIISSNQFADAYYKGCLDLAYRTRLNSAKELNAAIQDCSTTRSELAVTPTKALKVYCWRNITVKVWLLGQCYCYPSRFCGSLVELYWARYVGSRAALGLEKHRNGERRSYWHCPAAPHRE